MKRRTGFSFIAVFVVMLVVLLAGGCAMATQDTGSKTSEGAQQNEPIVIGGTLPLSGPLAETGRYVYDGYKQWVEDINAKGGLLGRPVQLDIKDDRSDPAQAVTLLENVITSGKVDLIAGGYGGDLVAAQMSVAEQHKMVYVSQGGHMKSFQQGYKYSFGGPPLMGQWWYDGFFDWLKNQPKETWPTKAAMITVNNPIGQAVREGVVERLKEFNITVVMDEFYDLPLTSPEPLIAKAKEAGADLFFANGLFSDGVQTIRAIKDLNYRPKAILQGIGTLVPSWSKELGKDGDYVISGTAMHPDLPFEGVDHLNEVAAKLYGTKAPPYFMFGYAWMQVLGQAVEGAGTLEQDAIRDWLRNHEVSTVGGVLTFDERGLPERYSYVIQVINGQPTLVWPENVATTKLVYPMPWEGNE